MSTPPLVALSVRAPNPLDDAMKGQQLRSMLLGQQLTQANTQAQQLSNQQMQQNLQTQRSIVSASHDPAWDPTDPDTVLKTLSRYNVPLSAQATVMQGINSIRSGLNNLSKEDLQAADNAHSYIDDQLQSAKNAPDGAREKTYQSALGNIVQYAQNLAPNMRQSILREVSGAPPVFDSNWVDMQHGLLKTESALTEDALKKAQTAEAAGKGAQSQAEAGLANARIPGAQAESTIQGQQADMTPQQRALSGNLFYGAAGGDPQSQQALGLETQQKVATAQAGVMGAPAALRGVAPHLIPAAAEAYNKAGQDYATA